MFLYHIGFFTRGNAYKQEMIRHDEKFEHESYQNIILKAHKETGDIEDYEEKRSKILQYLKQNHGFELVE
ncbi:hypothetical protein SAMN04487895_10379 [Paenibacillus sophorae]|uniref:Uncharacterized protein n=1 Tax=Paenibacillus sophorae TaxID=1333845 RepID=A0A1H8JND6_9BACL|nr:hypothetical protein [Paenibacillus sophorae]QWU13414.1 hypothetical protein KP014_15550 [Paenibacillus sophorae]SEN81836.1 hypothetical protein SAMN04487895_10379 [Paenibacillus sophorae]